MNVYVAFFLSIFPRSHARSLAPRSKEPFATTTTKLSSLFYFVFEKTIFQPSLLHYYFGLHSSS